MASRSSERAKPHLGWRACLRIARLGLSLGLCLSLHGLWRLFRLHSPWPRIFLADAARAAGARIRVEGKPLRRNVLYVANHISWLDILALGGATGTAFVSKAEVRDWPVVGFLADRNRTIYVERADRKAVKGQAGTLRDALAAGAPVTLFAEGTTGDGLTLFPFRASLFAAVSPPPPGVRIQPVALDYGPASAEIAWTEEEGIAANARRLFNRKGHIPLTLRFCDPLAEDAVPDRKHIARESRAAIAAVLPPSMSAEMPSSVPCQASL